MGFKKSDILLPLAAFILSTASLAGTTQSTIQMVVITSSAFHPDAVNRNNLRAIFSMRHTEWKNGTPVKVYVFSDNSPEHQMFSKEILEIFPYQLRLAWDRQVFSGIGQYPEQVSSSKEMLAKIKLTPGSIGYIPIQEVSNDVRILQIQ